MVWLRVGAASGALAVALGAFGAHGLATRFANDPKPLATWSTASHYHLVHSGVLVLAATMHKPRACQLLAGGMLLFSGSLYLLVLSTPDRRWLGAVAPIGGTLLIAGWLALLL